MKIQDILNEADLSNQEQHSFNNILKDIQDKVKEKTGLSVTNNWLGGFLNKYHEYPELENNLQGFRERYMEAKNTNDKRTMDYSRKRAKEVRAMIIARNVLATEGLLDKDKNFKPQPKRKGVLSKMRQFYTSDASTTRINSDMAKTTRAAGSDEQNEWFAGLNDQQKNFVTNMRELDATEWARFKGIVAAKENKQQFAMQLIQFTRSNEVAHAIVQRMGLIGDNGKLNGDAVDSLREFLSSTSDARLRDIISKDMTNSGKLQAHTDARARNHQLNSMDKAPAGRTALTLKLYNYLVQKTRGMADRERSARRILGKLKLAHDKSGQMNDVGQGAMYLFNTLNGEKVDPKTAIAKLKARYFEPADREHRADKATGRNDQIRSNTEL
jgi:hypothetical protein